MFASNSDYHLEIYTTDTITNVTFYIPLPVKSGIPMIGGFVLDQDQFEQNNLSVEIVRSPPGLNFTGEYPLQNNTSWFLKITSKQISPDKTKQAVYKIKIENITNVDTPLLFIDTKTPFGNESVFLPKLDFLPSTPVKLDRRDRIEYTTSEDSQVIPVFADYSASPSAKVQIRSVLSGSNSWLQDYDAYGGNSYSDYYDWFHTGESHGWYTANGKLTSAHGVYPNFDLPEWQKVLNQKTT